MPGRLAPRRPWRESRCGRLDAAVDNAMEVVKATLRCEPRSDKTPRAILPAPWCRGRGCASVWGLAGPLLAGQVGQRMGGEQLPPGVILGSLSVVSWPRWARRPFPGIGAGVWFPGQRAQSLTRLLPPACSWVLIARLLVSPPGQRASRPSATRSGSLVPPWPHLVGGLTHMG